MFKIILSFTCLVCFALLCACNQINNSKETETQEPVTEKPGNELDDFAKIFLPLAGSAGIMEVELGKIAVTRSVNTSVLKYAKTMVKEHSQINKEYRKLMSDFGMVPPDKMTNENQEMVAKLRNTDEAEFNKTYIDMMVNDHAFAVQIFDSAYSHAKVEDYKKWLSKMQKIVREHHHHALELQKEGSTSLQHF